MSSSSPKLLVKFSLFLDTALETLYYQVLEQDESYRGRAKMADLNIRGWNLSLYSYSCPDLTEYTVYLRGTDKRDDLRISQIRAEYLRNRAKTSPGIPKDAEDYASKMLELFSIIGVVRGTLIPDTECVFEVWSRSREQ